MEGFNNSNNFDYYDYDNCTDEDDNCTESISPSYHPPLSVEDVVTCVIICIGLPLTLVAIYGFYSLVRKDHIVPVYIINLLISDLIQFCCLIVYVAKPNSMIQSIFLFIHVFALIVSIGFMVCISMERYLIIAWPVWYRFRRNIKTSVGICVMVWVLPLVFLLILFYTVDDQFKDIIFSVLCLLPLPLFIFFLVGTCKALSGSRVSSDEKRRIVAVLVVVLLIYALLFLPAAILYLKKSDKSGTFTDVASILLKLSPLADLFLYVFSRKGAVDKLLSSLCCYSVDKNDISRPTDQTSNTNNDNM